MKKRLLLHRNCLPENIIEIIVNDDAESLAAFLSMSTEKIRYYYIHNVTIGFDLYPVNMISLITYMRSIKCLNTYSMWISQFEDYDDKEESRKMMMCACACGAIDIVRKINYEGFIIPKQFSPDHIAAKYGNIDLLKYMLSKGVTFDNVDELGKYPANYAAKYGNKECLKFIMENWYNKDLSENIIHGILQDAISNGNLDCVHILHKTYKASFKVSDLIISASHNNTFHYIFTRSIPIEFIHSIPNERDEFDCIMPTYSSDDLKKMRI